MPAITHGNVSGPTRSLCHTVWHFCPRGHLRLLLDRVKEPEARDWYLQVAVREGVGAGTPSATRSNASCMPGKGSR